MGGAASVQESRHWDRLMAMAALGAIRGADGEPGVNRACLTELDRAARRLLIGWAGEAGLTVSVDAAANLFLRHEGTDPDAAPVLTGSHMDSQPNGGRFDGIWGVLAGLEAVQAIREAGIATKRPIEVVAWTNEEGGRFAPGCMGSMSYNGCKRPEDFAAVTDAEGITFGDALRALLESEADIARRPLGGKPFAYVEAHIEQGPVLEREGLDIGVVTGIQGSRWFTVTITGETAHAGTAPLGLRRDAVQDMVRAIEALNRLMADPADILRFTVGRVEVGPNSSNTVADRAVFSIDFRHPDAGVLTERGDAIEPTIRAAVRNCDVHVLERFHALPAVFDPMVREAVSRAASGLGYGQRDIASGAFHDAQFMVPLCPTGMIFIPCRKGISHNPAEYSSPEQVAKGTRVLAATLEELAAR
ncbi:M20 family metallo-hydrolase [Roseomonas sp. NAR14]|uniref:M20 family metallo-hydrolase n=1 Tax=Roseomonas acroporae TaxID=2937791 RepID=A0A9X1YBH5_9PROT|nr:M20 family metallo-hydrolase [Roseomonas acroporae]MCK8786682.1 M20 family metallo-hydrolase [Roseomonas acroporae]